MYVENTINTPHDDQLRSLEASRSRLLDRMRELRCDCADIFADPRRSIAERDGAAWELAEVVGQIQRCDDELHELREQARGRPRTLIPARSPERAEAGAPGWFL